MSLAPSELSFGSLRLDLGALGGSNFCALLRRRCISIQLPPCALILKLWEALIFCALPFHRCIAIQTFMSLAPLELSFGCAERLGNGNGRDYTEFMSSILGISAFYHDSAAAILVDGNLKAAAQEERFTRIKHESCLPVQSIEYCLLAAGLNIEDVDAIVFYEKPFITFERLLETYLSYAPHGFSSFIKAMPVWLREKLTFKSLIRHELQAFFEVKKKNLPPIFCSYHHLSHAASAFYPSPFHSAAVLCADGVGEWATTSLWQGQGKDLTPLKEIQFPHSLGLLYSAFTQFCGFKVNSGEYKLMGLAPYGEPTFVKDIYEHLIDVKEDGSFRLNLEYFDYPVGLSMISDCFEKLFGKKARQPNESFTQLDMNLAASIQKVLEDVLIKICQELKLLTGERKLCLAGGVALNCVANAKVLQSGLFDEIWIQPAAGDAGGAVGAAWAYYHQHLAMDRTVYTKGAMSNTYLGPQFAEEQVISFLEEHRIAHDRFSSTDEMIERVAELLSQGKVIGWFQGPMEFGPRALGNRSILADPRSPEMQSLVNKKVKFRESFRPLAPSVSVEDVPRFFENGMESPYMILTFQVKESEKRALSEGEQKLQGLDKLKAFRSNLASITHVDYSARVQTVDSESNPVYHKLLKAFEKRTGYPILINTSFNIRGEPIVCTPKEAYDCFLNTDLDYLMLEGCLLDKVLQQVPERKEQWREQFVPD